MKRLLNPATTLTTLNLKKTAFTLLCCTVLMLVLTGAPTAVAQSPNFSDFSSAANLTLNGSAAPYPNETPTVLRLTPATGGQAGSAWFNIQQPVAGGFTTTFQFQFTGGTVPPADGIAFVIQNSRLSALGQGGGSIGYADGGGTCTGIDGTFPCDTGGGIPNSLAVEFDTYNNASATGDPDGNHIAVQSCGVSDGVPRNNSPAHVSPNDYNFPDCLIGTVASPSTVMSDGAVHTVTIDYTPPGVGFCDGPCPGTLTVTLDNIVVSTTSVTIENQLNLNPGGNAWVGFTSATGFFNENHDILSWTFTPEQSQSGTVMQGTETFFNFEGGVDAGGYNYNAELTDGSPVMAQVTAIPVADQSTCNTIVQANPIFHGAQCFVYDKGNGTNAPAPVMFELTCPGSPGGTCGTDVNPTFFATLGTDFHFTKDPLNPLFNSAEPLVGWLKGVGPDPLHPCRQNANNTPPLFHSNQISSFSSIGDPLGIGKGTSGGTGSCWLLTYNTPNEAPTVHITTPADGATYPQGASINANFACTAVNAGSTSPTGPYLTVPSGNCTGTVPSGSIDTSLGLHTFTATVKDSATNTVSQPVTYTVVGPADVAILKVAPRKIRSGTKLTYLIAVGDFGPANAVNVIVNDPLPPGTAFLSASGTNLACSTVNGKFTCSTTPVPCAFAGGIVSCNAGTIMPFAFWSLNGAVIQITVQVTAPAGTLNNTATVSASNADPRAGNNSSTASTTVTAH